MQRLKIKNNFFNASIIIKTTLAVEHSNHCSKGPQAHFHTCAYTWLSAFYVQVKQQLLLLKRVSLLPMLPLFLSSHPETERTERSLPG